MERFDEDGSEKQEEDDNKLGDKKEVHKCCSWPTHMQGLKLMRKTSRSISEIVSYTLGPGDFKPLIGIKVMNNHKESVIF